jgi:hypothetical protein
MGFHFQNTVTDWPRAVAALPPRASVKAVDRGDVLRDAKAHNAGVFTVLRHWQQHQTFGGTVAENEQRAREFFATFIDGTFKAQYAPHVNAIEELNEYIASSHTADETFARLTWARAAAKVWRDEYRSQPEYQHIRLILCNTAVGNDMHPGFAEIALNYDAILGYHPYSLIRNGVRDPGDWRYHSGRWHYMEQSWNMRPVWAFTEAGPYAGVLEGWRHPGVLNGDAAAYVEAVRAWLKDVQQTAAYKEGRIIGFHLFTTGGTSEWQYYETKQPELDALAAMIAQEWKPGSSPPPPPPPEPEKRRITVNLLPQDATFEEKWQVLTLVHDSRESMVQSADDAAELTALGRDDSKVKAWAADRWTGNAQELVDYLLALGAPNVELHEFPQEYEIADIVDSLPKHATKTYPFRALSEITTLTIHHTVSPPDRSIASIAKYHVDHNDWPGIGYHFVINDKGDIYQTNHLHTKSYHAGSYNAPGDENLWSVGIALQGDFTNNPPPIEQLAATRWLVLRLQGILGELDILGHRQMPGAQTQCPGNTHPGWLPILQAAKP